MEYGNTEDGSKHLLQHNDEEGLPPGRGDLYGC